MSPKYVKIVGTIITGIAVFRHFFALRRLFEHNFGFFHTQHN